MFLVVSCAETPRESAATEASVSGNHPADPVGMQAVDWNRPGTALELGDQLREISGIALVDEEHIVAVQDEEGRIYVLDLSSGEVTGTYAFGKKGDYEDVANVDDVLWILRSDATLFEVRDWRSDNPDVTEHETQLKKKCDAEGLAYDRRAGRLLIACKEDPGKGIKNARAVYAFDLRERDFAAEPAYTLPFDALARHLASIDEEDAEDFKPSAVAVHPVTGDVYVLSSVLKALVVLSPEGEVQAAHELPKGRFAQPEGLTFSPDGRLFISNEGPAGPATLLSYDIRR